MMGSLRILPDESLLGPVDQVPEEGLGPDRLRLPDRQERDLYGPTPRPKTYGPVIPRPTQTTTNEESVYGPKVVRGNEATPS